MARKHAQIRVDIWGIGEFRGLGVDAQLLYIRILTDPKLSFVGKLDWRPGKIQQSASDWDAERFWGAAEELAQKHYVVVDAESEEVIIRSFVRNDHVLKQPKVAIAATNDYLDIGSDTLRSALVWELRRMQLDFPELACWGDERMQRILAQPAVDIRKVKWADNPFWNQSERVSEPHRERGAEQMANSKYQMTPHKEQTPAIVGSPVDGGDDW